MKKAKMKGKTMMKMPFNMEDEMDRSRERMEKEKKRYGEGEAGATLEGEDALVSKKKVMEDKEGPKLKKKMPVDLAPKKKKAVAVERDNTEESLASSSTEPSKKGKTSKKTIRLGREQLFDSFNSPEFFPLSKVKNIIAELKAGSDYVLDFTGVEQLTDIVFHILMMNYQSSSYDGVKELLLDGCIHLTDQALHWIAKCFQKLTKVSLAGCLLMTETGLYQLTSNCKQLKTINLNGTSVAVLPRAVSRMSVSLQGCPVISPNRDAFGKTDLKLMELAGYGKSEGTDLVKVLFIRGRDVTRSVVKYMTRKADENIEPLTVEYSAVLSEGVYMNFAECDEILCDMFITKRTLIVLPFEAGEDKVRETALRMYGLICYIFSKVQKAAFVVMGLTTGTAKPAQASAVKKEIEALISDGRTKLAVEVAKLKNPQQMTGVDTEQQEMLKMKCSLSSSLEGIKIESVDVNLQTSMKEQHMVGAALKKSLQSLNQMYPEYEDLAQPVYQYINSPILASTLKDGALSMDTTKADIRKMMEIASIMGKTVVYKHIDGTLTVLYAKWLADVVTLALTPPKESFNDGQVSSVSDTAPMWKNDDLLKAFEGAFGKAQAQTALQIVSHMGLSIHPSVVLSYSNLSPEPHLPLEHFFPEVPPTLKDKELYHSVRYDIELDFPCPAMVLHKMAYALDIVLFRRPLLQWQTGFVIQEGLVEMMVDLKKQGSGSCLTLCVHTMKAAGGSWKATNTSLVEMLWNAIEQYKLVVQYILMRFNISYKMSLLSPDEPSAAKPENVRRLISSHTMRSQPVEKASENQKPSVTCVDCGVRPKSILLLWKMHLSMTRGFFSKDTVAGGAELVKQSGNMLTFTAEGKCVLNTSLFPQDYNTFSFSLLQGQMDHTVTVSLCNEFAYEIAIKFSTGEVIAINKGQPNRTLFKIAQGSLPCLGEDLTLELKEDVSMDANSSRDCLLFIRRGQEILGRGIVPFRSFTPAISSGPGNTFLVHSLPVEVCQRRVEITEGMRLEALDRQNPHLICVATVANVSEDGKILIHFDGWGNNYDYWAEPDSKDLHPVGWMAENNAKHRVNKDLQAPRGYRRKTDAGFTWPVYCCEEKCLPVPHDFFTEEQAEGTPITTEAACLEALQSSGHTGAGYSTGGQYHSACRQTTRRAAVLEHKSMAKCVMNPELFDFFANHSKFFCLLPKDFSRNQLVFPSLRYVSNMSEQHGHIVCPGLKLELLHFVDFDGVPLKVKDLSEIKEIADFIQKCCIGLILQEDILPDSFTKLCPGSDQISGKVRVDILMKKLLFMYVSLLELVKTTTDPVSNVTQSEAVNKMFKILSGDQRVQSHFSEAGVLYKCVGHASSTMSGQELSSIPEEKFKEYYGFIQKLNFDNNTIERLPVEFFKSFKNLESLSISNNQLVALPHNFRFATVLTYLDISRNHITELPVDFGKIAATITFLNISYNPLSEFPSVVWTFTKLEELHAENIGHISSFAEIQKLTDLKTLNLAGNAIDSLPEELASLPLINLDLSGVPWFPQLTTTKSSVSWRAFNQQLNSNTLTAKLSEEERQALFSQADVDESYSLTADELLQVNKVLYDKFPRFGEGSLKYEQYGGVPAPILKLKKLKKLGLSHHGLRSIPDDIKELKLLQELNVSNNPKLENMSSELAGLPFKLMHLSDCASLKTPPKEIISRGLVAVMGYFKRLRLGASPCKRTKLMLVGLGGAGKTSLVRSLTNKNSQAYMDYDEQITDGIDISNWQVPIKDEEDLLTFGVWDFAGQTVYYNTHQFFLSNRAVYLLLWNVRQGYEHAGLHFWLSSIACHAPKAPILVVGTHCDKVEKPVLPEATLKSRFSQIAAFHYVSSYTGEGVADLKKALVSLTLEQKYMGERIPQAWLSLEGKLKQHREEKSVDFLQFKQIEVLAHGVGIFERNELIQAIQFLHDLGSVQFFDTDFLRSIVVIYPQWIIDVMACLVTVHVGAVKDGRLKLKDLVTVWKDYPEDLHPWLLRLTEEFDLTCPLPNETSVVPCLLPDAEPKYDWPHPDPEKNIRESLTIYEFQYLPAGLFNRAQVRLHQFSEGSMMWKKGSFMKKKEHIALMLQLEDAKLVVRVQGFRPENFLLLVHEMFETLISESYAGVHYDFLVPCMDCQRMLVKEPSMISNAKVNRALEMSAPFIQCEKFFHIMSIPQIKENMPSDKMSEIDTHLRSSVRELMDLTQESTFNIFFCYTQKNVPDSATADKVVHPSKIMDDLRDQGSFKVTYTDKPETAEMEALTLSVKGADVVMIGMSDEFCDNQQCQKLLMFIKDILHKPILLVLLGKNKKWQKSELGAAFGTEVYVDMQNKERYPHKITELYDAIKKKATSTAKKDDVLPCFLSYCWSNSHDAVKKGSKEVEGALGWKGGDPRTLKTLLQDKGINTWIDVERVGGGGLFHSIADGLRDAKVMVACVSDEYVKSKNCIMEFRYALTTLRLPVILAVVGTGYEWERSEIGLLAVGHQCTKLNFQFPNEAGYIELLKFVQDNMPETGKTMDSRGQKEEKKRSAIQEVLELTQRKFLRHISTMAGSQDTQPYPRLIVIDFVTDDEKKTRLKKRQSVMQKAANNPTTPRKDDKATEGTGDQKAEGKRDNEPCEAQEAVEEGEPVHKSKYCFRILCEHEEGWHAMPTAIPFPIRDAADELQLIDNAAPYLSRMFAIIKHSNLQMMCLSTPEGEKFQQKIEEIGIKSKSDFTEEYSTLRSLVMQQDKEMMRGKLHKCNMSGKLVWLCDDHKLATRSRTEERYKDQLGSQYSAEEIPLPTDDKGYTSPIEPGAEVPAPDAEEEEEQAVKKHRQIFKKTSDMKGLKRQTSQMCSVM